MADAAEDASTIRWNRESLILIEPDGNYGRIIRLKSGALLCAYDRGGWIFVKHSADDGKSWAAAIPVAHSSIGGVTNAELLELQDGTVLCFFNERPSNGVDRFRIQVANSADRGKSWPAIRTLYEASPQFENGCWEPAAIQLPDGEIQLFFANEHPYQTTREQEISMMRSRDNGRTWDDAIAVSFRRGHRDGMPVPILLQGEVAGIAVAIEDDGLYGLFKPAIVFTSLETNWDNGPVTGASQHRWSGLRVPLGRLVYAGAPYLRQMPTGETILSVQVKEFARREPRMVVFVGNNQCRDFAGASEPFEVDANTASLWNALFVKSANTITAISGTTIDGRHGLWAIDGTLIRGDSTNLPATPTNLAK